MVGRGTLKSEGRRWKGLLRAMTAREGWRVGRSRNEPAAPEPSGRRKRIGLLVLPFPWRTTDVLFSGVLVEGVSMLGVLVSYQ